MWHSLKKKKTPELGEEKGRMTRSERKKDVRMYFGQN